MLAIGRRSGAEPTGGEIFVQVRVLPWPPKEKIMWIKLSRWLANRLPKRVVYFAVVRLVAYATTGDYKMTSATTLGVMDALKRWEKQY